MRHISIHEINTPTDAKCYAKSVILDWDRQSSWKQLGYAMDLFLERLYSVNLLDLGKAGAESQITK